jgi:cytochrome b
MADDENVPVRVWDLPTRVFHWLLALAVVCGFVAAWRGGNAMDWHLRIGYTVFALLLFRLVWGFVGGRWSRFRSFAYAPRTALRYLRGESRADEHHHVGHSPLGAFSVFALLGLLALQVGTGLFANDEIATTGPLNKFVSDRTASLATHWHTVFGQWLILALVLLHVGAIAFYRLRLRRDLVGPMWHGDKRLTLDVPPSVDTWGARAVALLVLVLAAALVTWVVTLGG